VSLRWKDVTAITKEKTALVIPNAILVCTEGEKLFFTSFCARDKTYLILFRVWQNTLMDKVGFLTPGLVSVKYWKVAGSVVGEISGFSALIISVTLWPWG
jgi:hypothetical protein